MKKEELDKIKKSLEEHGFEYIITDSNKDQVLMIIQKKDPWEGVEFIEKKEKGDMWVRKVLQPILPHHNAINFQMLSDEKTDGCGYAHKDFVKPSTESAYIEQLKQQAFERFGEIKHLDNFKSPNGHQYQIPTNYGFQYFKSCDVLRFSGITIYQQGRWATKLPEKFDVEFIDDSWDDLDDHVELGYVFKIKVYPSNIDQLYKLQRKSCDYLKEQLTKYLNNENTKI